jgi:hypothetical protein
VPGIVDAIDEVMSTRPGPAPHVAQHQLGQADGRGDVEVDDRLLVGHVDVDEAAALPDPGVERRGVERAPGRGVHPLHGRRVAQVGAHRGDLHPEVRSASAAASRPSSSAVMSRSKSRWANSRASSSPMPLEAPVTRGEGVVSSCPADYPRGRG